MASAVARVPFDETLEIIRDSVVFIAAAAVEVSPPFCSRSPDVVDDDSDSKFSIFIVGS